MDYTEKNMSDPENTAKQITQNAAQRAKRWQI